MNDIWEARIKRANQLISIYPFASQALKFYAGVAAIQEELYAQLQATSENSELCVTLHRQNAHLPHVNSAFASVASLDFGVFGGCLQKAQPDATGTAGGLWDQLDVFVPIKKFPDFLMAVKRIAPAPLAQSADALAQGVSEAWRHVIEEFRRSSASPATDAKDASALERCLAWLFLQPCAEFFAGFHPARNGETHFVCPVCGSKPIVGVLRPEGNGASKSLVCMLCASEWPFRRVCCPACGEEREPQLAFYSAPEIAHVRVDVCDSCHTYLKCVDLTRNGLAVPIVDELATLPLDLWAGENGYTKMQVNMLGL